MAFCPILHEHDNSIIGSPRYPLDKLWRYWNFHYCPTWNNVVASVRYSPALSIGLMKARIRLRMGYGNHRASLALYVIYRPRTSCGTFCFIGGLSADHFYVRSRGRLSPRVMDAVVSLGQLKTCILHSAGWTEDSVLSQKNSRYL